MQCGGNPLLREASTEGRPHFCGYGRTLMRYITRFVKDSTGMITRVEFTGNPSNMKFGLTTDSICACESATWFQVIAVCSAFCECEPEPEVINKK